MTARCPFPSRRLFLGGVGAAASFVATRAPAAALAVPPASFRGAYQTGILTPQQAHTYFAAFDVTAPDRAALIALLRQWTEAADRLTSGATAAPLPAAARESVAPDSGDALGLGAARLTLTFGFGAGLFTKDGKDRYGLAKHRPDALVDLPEFTGDQLEEARTGGDLSVQACADDPQVAFHAVRQLARLAGDAARLRWTQTGFVSTPAGEETPRNLLGFKDGTQNPVSNPTRERAGGVTLPNPLSPDEVVWAGTEGPIWMRRGTYLVVRRIRMALEHWDGTDLEFQELTIGRHKYSGAPLGGKSEFEPIDLDAADGDGNPLIPQNAHVRMAAAAANDGAQMLRRGYSYNDGVNVTAERWPPWRQGLEYDAGLLFICYQRDPRTSFIKIFEPMAKLDALNQYTTHTGGGLFACPPGVGPGEYVGQSLFDAA